MAIRKTTRSKGTAARKRPPGLPSRHFSAVVGGALIGVALLWFAWLIAHQLNPGIPSLTFPLPGNLPANAPADPLAAAGITLSSPAQGQEPLLTRQQAILLVNEMETQVASRANGVDASYTLFSYKGSNPAVASSHGVPVWLVHYTKISEPHPDTAADPHASSSHHDFYVFLDANSGRELLAIWL
jgi:hypothetical protein